MKKPHGLSVRRRGFEKGRNSRLHDREFQFGAGDDFSVDGTGGDGLADVAAHFGDFGIDEKGVSGDDRLAEFDVVGAEEVTDFSLVVRKAHDEDGGGLCHGLELEDAWHDGVSGEVALEEFLVHGEVFNGGALHLIGEAGHAINEEERISMGKNTMDVLRSENRFGFGELERWNHRAHLSVFFFDTLGGFGVWAMAGLDGDDMAAEFFPGKHEVSDDVEGFVAGEFVLKAHGLFGHNFFAADDDGIFEGAAFDETFVEEGFNILVESKGSSWCDFFLVGLRIHHRREVLNEAAVFSDVGHGDAEFFIRNDSDEGTVPGFEMDGFANFPDLAGNGLFFEAGFFNELNVGAG